MYNTLANFLSILSLVSGFASIIFSLEGHFTFACWAIFLSVVFDGLDGQIARRNPVNSEFGKEIDSLVDVVSFAIAPSILGYQFIYPDCCLWAPPVLFIYLLCSILRLAKYNIISKDEVSSYFYGLPTTASGGTLASFVLIYRKSGAVTCPSYVPTVFLFLVLLLSLLMVSRIKYLNLDGLKQLSGRQTKLAVVILVILYIFAGYFKKAGILTFTLFVIYLLFSPFMLKSLETKQAG